MTVRADFVLRHGEFELQFAASLAPGEVVAVLGPNGSGKSTLLRALAGIERIDSGVLSFDEAVVDDGHGVFVSPQRRSVGMVFQDYALFPHLTLLDNVAFGPRARGTGRRAAEELARQWLARVGLEAFAARRPGEVSGGQAQRAAVARALAVAPGLLLLDEPLAALDVQVRDAVRAELDAVLAEFDGCVLLVTHDPLDALLLADRVIVLEHGRIVQDDRPASLARRPATDYVASLMGVNLLRGSADDGVLAVAGGGEIRIADRALCGPALAVIRPEAVTLHRHQPEGSARNVWPGRVGAVQPMHDRVRVQVDAEPSIIATVTPDAVAELGLVRGADVWVSVKAVDLDAYPTAG